MRKRNLSAKLLHQIIFLHNISSSETEDENWQEICHSFAEIKPICDNRFISLEGLEFGNIITEELFLFKVRFLKNLNSAMRIKFKTRIFEIKRIINIEEKDRMLNIIGLEVG